MCLAVPAKIVSIDTASGLRMAKVDFGGVFQTACLEAVPNAVKGDYVIVHAGFALNVLSPEEAQQTLSLLRAVSDLENEINPVETLDSSSSLD